MPRDVRGQVSAMASSARGQWSASKAAAAATAAEARSLRVPRKPDPSTPRPEVHVHSS